MISQLKKYSTIIISGKIKNPILIIYLLREGSARRLFLVCYIEDITENIQDNI
jgi:hypothetical protein